MSWIPLSLLSALFASGVAIFGKLGLKEVDPILATTIRVVIMAVFFLVVSYTVHSYSLLHTIQSRTLMYITLSGISGALSWLCYFYALKNGPAGGVASLDRLSVVFVVILAALLLGESITVKTGIGAVLVVLGALCFVL